MISYGSAEDVTAFASMRNGSIDHVRSEARQVET